MAGNDPLRTNNPPCLNNSGVPLMTILDSPKTIGLLPASAAVSSNFAIKMATDAVFADNGANGPTPTVEMLLEVQAATSGKTASGDRGQPAPAERGRAVDAATRRTSRWAART